MKKTFILFTFLILVNMLLAKPGNYPDFATLKENLERIARNHSKLAKLENLGTTLGGKEIILISLGSGKMDTKPAILLVGGVNGTDLAGTELLLQFIESNITNYGKIDSITRMLDRTTFYVIPRINPDATESLFLKPAYGRSLNIRPLDLDADGVVDEDGYDDLNKDGIITQMRITEVGGEWVEDEEHRGLMRRAEKENGEEGIYRVISEGFDNDGDGKLNEDEKGGVNFNKNFSYKYTFFETGSGPHPISEIESRAVADFVFAHSNIAAVFSFSSHDNLITPWEPSKKPAGKGKEKNNRQSYTSVDKNDAPLYKYISDEYKKITGVENLPRGESGSGAFNEWVYYHFGRWSFSTPAWIPPLVAADKDASEKVNDSESVKSGKNKKAGNSSKSSPNKKKTYEQQLWAWLNSSGRESEILEWKEVKHPDYPDKKVEIGGLKPMAYSNPPADSLTKMGHHFQTFMVKMNSWLPQIDINEVQVKHLHDNVYRVSVVIRNTGYLATNPHAGVRNKWCPKIKVTLGLKKNQKLASGKVLNFIDILAGSGGSKEFSWLILGESGETVKIAAGSPMAGEVTRIINLK